MPRRVHVGRLTPGQFSLDPAQAHHVRDVLRLSPGSPLELFDDTGHTATASIIMVTPSEVVVEPGEIRPPSTNPVRWTVASAVPKSTRADWMIEKLSELGTDAFIPLQTQRSVVHPEGTGKLDRWRRISLESAKQSCRPGPVMRIDEMLDLEKLIRTMPDTLHGWYFSTQHHALPIAKALAHAPTDLLLLIGPEGGWTDAEESLFEAHGLTALSLTQTILRIETAAIAAASVIACCLPARKT